MRGERISILSERTMALDRVYWRWFARLGAAAVVAHAVVIGFFVPPSVDFRVTSGSVELVVIDMPPETRIPPPPEEIARPATPVVGTQEVAEEVTIAETDIVEDQAIVEAPPGPPPEPGPIVEDVGPTFSFTPYTRKPACRSGCSPDDVLRYIPPLLKRGGLECELTVGIRIDTAGQVTATDLLRSSGVPGCDASAEKWALSTEWTVAYNRDEPVVVWIAQPLSIAVR